MATKRVIDLRKTGKGKQLPRTRLQVLWYVLGNLLELVLSPNFRLLLRRLSSVENIFNLESRAMLEIKLERARSEFARLRDGHNGIIEKAVRPLQDKIDRLERTIAGLEKDIALRGDHDSDLIRQCNRKVAEKEAAIFALEGKNAQLAEMAYQDLLTALLNRRGQNEMFAGEYRMAPFGTTVTVAAFDLDRFKAVNDAGGHAAGDGMLRLFALLLRTHFKRSTDLVGRLGGDEFVVICFNQDGGSSYAQQHCQILIDAIRESQDFTFTPKDGAVIQVTASVGIASRVIAESDAKTHPEAILAELMQSADEALYRAKREGRNRMALAEGVTTFSGLPPQ